MTAVDETCHSGMIPDGIISGEIIPGEIIPSGIERKRVIFWIDLM